MPPAEFKTLIDMLRYRAAEMSDKAAFSFSGGEYSYGLLWNGLNRFAAHLNSLNVMPGDRVVVVLPNGPEFFFAFYGTQRIGAIAVPLFPGFGPERILSTARDCGANVIVAANDQIGQGIELVSNGSAEVTTVAASSGATALRDYPDIAADDLAFIQYTSGSTGNPKGVVISHDNLLTNIRQMVHSMRVTEADVFVSWLPVYHDMGLIMKTMMPFYLAADLHLLPTSLHNVGVWLSAIQDNRATFTAAPDFAYRMCVQQARRKHKYDLSTLRIALNAAEPVRHRTVVDFENIFGLKDVMVAAYGLAEATLGVSMSPPGQPVRKDRHGHVSVGKPFPDVEIAIVGNGEANGSGDVGEIAVKSAALPGGYFDNPQATQELHWRPGWILTGDLGYIDEAGDLFIVGRKKSTIIQAGRNLYPQEIEEIVDGIPAVRRSIAVGIERGRLEGEQTYIFAEIRKHTTMSQDSFQDIVVNIVGELHRQLGFRPGRVLSGQTKDHSDHLQRKISAQPAETGLSGW